MFVYEAVNRALHIRTRTLRRERTLSYVNAYRQ